MPLLPPLRQWQALLRAKIWPLAPGLLLVASLTGVALWLSELGPLAAKSISPLTLAIILGMGLGNLWSSLTHTPLALGVAFSRHRLLRLGIVLYGFRLTLHDVMVVGLHGVAIDVVIVISTFALAVWAGKRFFAMDTQSSMLVGAGSAVCGVAAVLATEPVVGASSAKAAVAVATVVVFGTIAMFVYPVLYHLLGTKLAMTPSQYGLYTGSTVHEVAQVVAAARTISAGAANTAVVAKMVRVMLLAPLLIGLSLWRVRPWRSGPTVLSHPNNSSSRAPVHIPWFAVGFVAVTLLGSFLPIPQPWIAGINTIDTLILSMAMAALGLGTHVSVLRQTGLKPLALAGALFVWLLVGGWLVNRWLG